MTGIPEVRSTADRFLPRAVVLPPVSIRGFQLDGIFIRATRTRTMLHAMGASVVVFVIGIAALVPFFGNHGLRAASYGFMVSRAVTPGIGYPALEPGVSR